MNRARPFPKILITILLLALTGGVLYLVCLQNGTERLAELYESYGAFICKYDNALIIAILAVNLVELIDMVVCGKRDEAIHAGMVYMQGNMNLFEMFKQFFAPIFCTGPYLYASRESGSAPVRMVIGAVTGVVKFLYWLSVLLVGFAMIVNPDFYEIVQNGNPDYWYTAMILFACINCNIFLFSLISMLPAYQVQEYERVTTYRDGSITRRREVSSNLIAILVLAAVIYGFYSAYYVFPLSGKINRCVETQRFREFVGESRYDVSIMDYYRHK